MAAVVVAGQAGVEPETVVLAAGSLGGGVTQVDRVVVARADEEALIAFGGGHQHLVQGGHRAVVQERRRRPDPGQRPRLVADDLLRQVERTEALQARLLRLAQVVVLVVTVFQQQVDQVQAQSFGDLARVDGRQQAGEPGLGVIQVVPERVDLALAVAGELRIGRVAGRQLHAGLECELLERGLDGRRRRGLEALGG